MMLLVRHLPQIYTEVSPGTVLALHVSGSNRKNITWAGADDGSDGSLRAEPGSPDGADVTFSDWGSDFSPTRWLWLENS